jgi:hypothetical protein
MKRKLSLFLIVVLSMSTCIELAKANPYVHIGHSTDVSPPAGTQAPIISIHTPQNGSAYPRNIIPLTFDIIIPHTNGDKSVGYIEKLYYEASWESNPIQISEKSFSTNTSFSINLYITRGGNLSITIYAVGGGTYETGTNITGYIMNYYYDRFEMVGSSTVSFSQDFVPPRINVISPQNRSYDKSDVKLGLTANEALSKIMFCLDGNQNQTITGNATLTYLTNGTHNVTLYAADLAGNMVASDTISFNVAKSEPFPIAIVAVVSAFVTVVVAAAGLLVYFKKRKNRLVYQ